MLDNGYALTRVELLNWGNFHGYQKFSLHTPSEGGPLFSAPPASAILGINGSGKSTLIDALMIVLLPFEGSLKLGVTNDIETGGSGGRTIRDYVLGKHSSQSGMIADPDAVFGRRSGCSMVLLTFTHNRHPRELSLGRAWWYQNHKVGDSQVAFVSYQGLKLPDLCPLGKTAPTAKAFRQHIKTAITHVQVFETMQSYFTAASQALGNITRDDLKILNRAFFVKSISNIDQFIRENMLIEQESPNVERLLENVRSGQEIAYSIETCEAKIAAIARILRELNRLHEFNEIGRAAEAQLRLLRLHREWSDWQALLKQSEQLKRECASLELRLPHARASAESASEEFRTAQARLLADNIELRLSHLDAEIEGLEGQIQRKLVTLENWRRRATDLQLRLPASAKAWESFLEENPKLIESLKGDIDKHNKDCEDLRERRYAMEALAKEMREEIEHISRSGTLLPRDLCAIRDAAVKELRIPKGELRFVGELLQVKRDQRHVLRAAEAALFPIARNLLCHPDHLHALTHWLDKEGLRADITVKRITSEEINKTASENLGEDKSFRQNSILGALEMRPDSDHPFSVYLWTWLRESFDYQLVDVKQFKSLEGRLVTREGLAKKDQRTMRKLKSGFAFSLGWENSERLEELTKDLTKLQDERSKVILSIEEKVTRARRGEEAIQLLKEMSERRLEVLGSDDDQHRVKQLKLEKQTLLQQNPDHNALRERVKELDEKVRGLQRGLVGLENDYDNTSATLKKVEGLIPSREKDLRDSKLFSELLRSHETEENLFQALNGLQTLLNQRGMSRLQLESEISEEAAKAETGRSRAISMAAVNLGNYRHTFNDPNLPYELGGDTELTVFLREWNAADQRLKQTELPGAQEKWRRFFDQVLLDSVKDMINEIKSRVHEVDETVRSINEVLKLTNFEDLPHDQRYLRIEAETSSDERIRKFRKQMTDVEKTLLPSVRARIETQSQEIMTTLSSFVDEFQKDTSYRSFVTDVRNHFQFAVQSLRRSLDASREDEVVEMFSGARRDAKSSAQTTQLAYALLASCLAYRFRFHDPLGGADTPRLIVFDEFGGKFDNEKPREILRLLDKMGFQSVLVSPMSKADLLADGISHLVLVHKVSASHSKVQSYQLNSKDDYERLLNVARNPQPPVAQGETAGV